MVIIWYPSFCDFIEGTIKRSSEHYAIVHLRERLILFIFFFFDDCHSLYARDYAYFDEQTNGERLKTSVSFYTCCNNECKNLI